MSAPAPPAPRFRAALASDRAAFNQKFAEARRRHPDLDGDVFGELLRTLAGPVVESASAARGEAALAVAHAAYDAGLVLASERLAGPGGRHPAIDELWRRVLPGIGALVADQPVRVLGALSNAVFQVSSTPGARPLELVERLAGVAGSVPSVEDVLRAAAVAAWRAGLAYLREAALSAGDALPGSLASALAGAPRAEWVELRERLAGDPWWDPERPDERTPRVARMVGGFRGFGGPFARPPLVGTSRGRLLVTDGSASWHLVADAFGATFHRADGDDVVRAERAAPVPLGVPALGRVTSTAAVHRTLAVTGDASHAVALVALP